MAPNVDSIQPVDSSTLPEILDYFWSLMDNCKLNHHKNCRHWRNRPHMLTYFPSQPDDRPSAQVYNSQRFYSISESFEESNPLKDLERTLKAITRSRNLETKTKAIDRISEWRQEQLNLTHAEKNLKVSDDNSLATNSDIEKMQELIKLPNSERHKWNMEIESYTQTTEEVLQR
ncbi:unnamed protein product [Calypogeia fissa]